MCQIVRVSKTQTKNRPITRKHKNESKHTNDKFSTNVTFFLYLVISYTLTAQLKSLI